jgi:glycosyltransferase involved in cell wall biosynthesis
VQAAATRRDPCHQSRTLSPLRVLLVSALDADGGAARVAGDLLRGLRSRGHRAWLAVGRSTTRDPDVFVLPDDDRPVYRLAGYAALRRRLGGLAARSGGRGWGMLGRSLRLAAHPRALSHHLTGVEDFEYPGTRALLDVPPARPDIVHCHNLHGGYFDLRALEWLGRDVPTVLTLHDGWLLSGHCAHSFDCERWASGCGDCPDLSTYPAIRRDATAANWVRKRGIYARSRLYVTSPSEWLMRRVERSMLGPVCQLARVIPNGVDLSIFRRADKLSARRELGLSPDAAIVLVIPGSGEAPWTDHAMLEEAARIVARRRGNSPVTFLLVGASDAPLDVPLARRDPWQTSRVSMARYFQAADVYFHCARAGTFPTTVLESLACGTPVVAAAVGGIPEQITSAPAGTITETSLEAATGCLVAPGDAASAADRIITLLENAWARDRLSENAAADARRRFDLDRQVASYLGWYQTIIHHWHEHAPASSDGISTRAAGSNRLAVV